mgnify:CR=1 FL=1
MKKILKNNEKSFKLTTLGFTLIELLGVLIILAIIALITFPIIDNVLTNSRQQAYERSIDGIIEASKMYVTSQGLIPSTTTKQLSLQTLINSGFLEDKDIIDPRNNESMTGCVLYSWNNSTNQYKYRYDEECVLPAYAIGDLLKVDVGGGQTQNIYILEINGDEITGILDRNLGSTVAWISNEDYNSAGGNWDNDSDEVYNQNLYKFGPITANKALEERTSNWSNVTSKKIPSAEDILKLTEFYQNLSNKSNWESEYFTRINEMFENSGISSCSSARDCRIKIEQAGYGDVLVPEWATINLFTTGDCSEDAAYAYWTSTPADYEVASDPYDAWYVGYDGALYYFGVGDSVDAGVRPVITISTSNIINKLESPEYIDDNGFECQKPDIH